jgi:hypothetical protein
MLKVEAELKNQTLNEFSSSLKKLSRRLSSRNNPVLLSLARSSFDKAKDKLYIYQKEKIWGGITNWPEVEDLLEEIIAHLDERDHREALDKVERLNVVFKVYVESATAEENTMKEIIEGLKRISVGDI